MRNNTSRYIKYAIGEIVLVVIGILFALQINNWNEFRKQRLIEKDLLNEMRLELIKDTSNLAQEYGLLNISSQFANTIKKYFKEKLPYEIMLDTAFARISYINVLEPNYIVYNRAKDLGMDIIKNDSIRSMITNYYENSIRLKSVERYYEVDKYYRTVIYPKYFKEYQFATKAVPLDYETLKLSSEFKIALDYSINDTRFYMAQSRFKMQLAKKLLGAITAYLNKNEYTIQ